MWWRFNYFRKVLPTSTKTCLHIMIDIQNDREFNLSVKNYIVITIQLGLWFLLKWNKPAHRVIGRYVAGLFYFSVHFLFMLIHKYTYFNCIKHKLKNKTKQQKHIIKKKPVNNSHKFMLIKNLTFIIKHIHLQICLFCIS